MVEVTLLREPTVAEILADPMTKLMMRRDGVTEEQVRRLMRHAAAARQASRPKLARSEAASPAQVAPLAAAARSGY